MLDKTATALIHVPAGELCDALKRVRHAMSTEETRYYLSGAFLHSIDGKVKICATDGHRLALVELRSASIEHAALPGVILSAPAVAAILKSGIAKRSAGFHDAPMLVTPTSFAFHPYNNPSLEYGVVDRTNQCGLIDGTFPDYLRVLPRGIVQTVTLDRDAFRKAVAACFGFIRGASDNAASSVKFDFFDKQCLLSAEHVDGGKASYKLDTADPVQQPIQIGFNGRYVLDILDVLDGETVSLGLTDPGSPTTFNGTDTADSHALHVLMPMRV